MSLHITGDKLDRPFPVTCNYCKKKLMALKDPCYRFRYPAKLMVVFFCQDCIQTKPYKVNFQCNICYRTKWVGGDFDQEVKVPEFNFTDKIMICSLDCHLKFVKIAKHSDSAEVNKFCSFCDKKDIKNKRPFRV